MHARGTATINGIEGFWAYANEGLLRPHGVADDHFLLYLKEVEYRFNHRELEPQEFVNHLLSEVLLACGWVHELQNALPFPISQGRRPDEQYRFGSADPLWLSTSLAEWEPRRQFSITITEIRSNPYVGG